MSRLGHLTLLLAGVVLLVILAGGLSLERAWTGTRGSARGDTLLVVPQGASARGIASLLAGAGVLESPRLFVWRLRLAGEGHALRAGRYRFSVPCAPAEILDKLRRGDTEKLWLTLPEGLWLDEAVGRIARSLDLDSLALARAARRPSQWNYAFLRGSQSLEGFLFPETYVFEYPADPETVLSRLLESFAQQIAILAVKAPLAWDLSVRDWVTLASIVEAEGGPESERRRIAAVYLNRLRRGMRLEADPTVLYGLGERRQRLFYLDLDLDSPYNTYRRAGLPPGPICSPGRASLQAVLEADPAERSLYFVASGEGGHLFAETFAQHRRNLDRLRRNRR